MEKLEGHERGFGSYAVEMDTAHRLKLKMACVGRANGLNDMMIH